mgnify:CR=1 FL=1
MTAVVLGLGRMGQCIASAMHRLGFKIVCADVVPNEYKLKGLVSEYKFIQLKPDKSFKKVIKDAEPDIVICSLPYHQLLPVAKFCITNNIRYCDLGGRVDVSEDINQFAKEKATMPVFTDLGLAPGWVNIVADHLAIGGADSIKMYVGGLPAMKTNPLNYMVTWSVDGLINEYVDDCIVLQNNRLQTVPGMSGHEIVQTCLGELEAFYTSGGASHTIESMKAKGVQNCSYKTFRYPGHIKMIDFLIRKCQLNDEALRNIFEKGCICDKGDKDIVLIRAEAHKGDTTKVYEKLVRSCDSFSAMQRATAYSISTVGSIMAAGLLDERYDEKRGEKTRLSLALQYRDVPYHDFENILNSLLDD